MTEEDLEHITRIPYQDKELILVGTAHVYQHSAELVKEVIEQEKPDSVCIELDEGRYNNMVNPKEWSETDLVDVIKEKKVGFMLANLVLGSYQKRLANQLGSNVGGEMVQGIQSAKETGAELVLADRDIQTTFMRIWRKMTLKEKFDLLVTLVFSLDDEEESVSEEEIANLLEKDMLEGAMSSLKEDFPKIGDILLSERDQYLANKIKNAPGKKVVAVLGAGHVAGISREIYKEQDMEEISKVPPAGKLGKCIGWMIPVAIVALIAYGFFQGGAETGLHQIFSWILWNGSLAALFTLIMRGHPISVLTAFLVAPISSMNPMLACGWFAGLMEAHIRKPKVEDVANLSTDITSLKGALNNRFIRTLLIVCMANIGSSLGTIIAGLDIIKSIL